MQRKVVNLNSWLKGDCQYKGCTHNDGYGVCLLEDTDFMDEMLDSVHEHYKDDKPIPEDKTFICTSANFDILKCEYCGDDICYHKEYVDCDKGFLPAIYEVCCNKECEENGI